jgi:hypothetical protein
MLIVAVAAAELLLLTFAQLNPVIAMHFLSFRGD